ncbi:MAG: hypothetical protein PHQ77_07370 [Proteiniphilum sp.]|nr:hypothetical protein [Proteiniphilum sp.]
MKHISILIFIFMVAASCHTKTKETGSSSVQYNDTVVTPADTTYLEGMDIPEYKDLPRQFVANHDRSMTYHMNLMESFEASGYGTYSTRPDYYGGSYIDDNGNFVILIKGNPSDYRAEIEERIKGKDVIFKQTDISFVELNEIMDTINKYISDKRNNKVAQNILSAALDELNSQIRVGLKDLNPHSIEEFKENVINSPYIEFEQGGYIQLE